MRKTIKWIAIGLGGIVAVFALVVAYLAATFNPNDYKADIVEDASRRRPAARFTIKGDIGLSIFPSLGVSSGRRRSPSATATRSSRAWEAFVAVKLMPLLAKEVIVDAVEVKGLRAAIEKTKPASSTSTT